MRSIHKKTLKRFLSTLLALTMVLGMVPFTASAAAPAPVTLTQSDLEAKITPSEPNPAAVTAGNTSDVTYTVEIAASAATANNETVTLTIDGTPYSFGNVTISGSPYKIISAATPAPFSLTTEGKITGTVTKNYAPGDHTVEMSLAVGTLGSVTETPTITVPRKAVITSLTATPNPVTAGEAFTVTAKSDINNGYIEFAYDTETVTETVLPKADGTGYATHTFTAVTGKTSVTAKQFGMSDGVVDSAVMPATITVNAAATYYDVTFMVNGLQYGEKQSVKSGEKAIRPVDPLVADGKVFAGWYTDNTFANVFDFATETITANTTVYAKVVDKLTITFLPGAADAYIPFSPTTVSVKQGDSYPLPAAIPTREGYTFTGWSDGTTTYNYDSTTGTFSTTAVPAGTTDVTLNAQWTVQKVTVTYPTAASIDGVHAISKTTGLVDKGSTVYFTIELDAGYDPSTLVVKAGEQTLAPVKAATDLYQYSFVANADTGVTITAPSKLTYTVMMPVGHFTAQITAANGAPITPAAASASINHGSGYTFTVKPASGYEIKGVYVNGAVQTADFTGADGTQTFNVTNVTSAQTVEVLVDEIPSYTVTYVVNDAQYTTQKVTSGSAIGTLPDNPVVEGYTFNSWNTKQDGSGTTLATTTTVSQDMTVYAQLTANTYTITYNANGGSSEPTAQTKTHGLAITLQPNVPTKAGHTFLGWGTTAAATTATYQPGDMYSTEGSITLYAVWKINTFTVTLPNGTGYTAMPATGSSSPVNYDEDFTFTVTVDPEYAVATPIVEVNGSELGAASFSDNTYTYTISDIQGDKVVSVSVTKNSVYTVTFQYTLPGSSTPTVYQTQQVEHNAKATVPNPPSVEGYTFGGWHNGATAYDFATPVTGNLTLTAKLTAITPNVTWDAPAANAGWTFDVTSADVTVPASDDIDVSPNTVKYGSKMEFNVVVKKGYDATNLAVAANGLALNPVLVTENPDGTTTYSFILSNITADQKITVTGVARKMVTITYNDNGGIGGPGQEQVPMYVPIGDEGKISNVKPTRVGYTFLGWAKANADGSIPTAKQYDPGATADFTTDTTLYAVWSAKTTTVTLTVDKTFQYEGENVTLTADVKSGATAVTSGSVQFYRSNNGVASTDPIGTAKVSGGKAVLTIATSAYKRDEANTDSYTVKFIPDEGSGYSKADTTAAPDVVTVLSAAISWKLDTGTPNPVADKANVLTIYMADADGNKTSTTTATMTAGQIYYLELPAIYALDETTYSDTTKLVVNRDYTVTWQFCNASGTWADYTAAAGTDSVKILAEYSQYVFRAVVTPLTGATGHFTKAAKYTDAGALTADSYVESLVTKATSPVAQQETATSLAVTDTHDIGSTVAEFEGQKVTLTATVVLKDTTTKVTTGEVYFYKVGSSDTLIGKANVQSDGTAVLEATMSTYSAGAKDTFKAVYQDNATYKTSESTGVDVLIRSTAIAWASSNALDVTPTGSIYADNQYTLTLPAIKEEGQDVTLTVGTDYVVSWYMVKADKTVVLLAENTESNTYTVVPPTAGVTYYAVVSPKAGSNYTDAYEDSTTKNFLTSEKTAASVQSPTITTITFGEVLTDTGKTPDFSQYEEKTITITAKVVEADLTTPTTAKDPEEVVKSGTVTFYVVTKSDGTYEKIGTATVSNGLATVSYKLPEYDLADGLKNIEYFFAVYSDTAGTYADSNTTENGTVDATVAHTNVNADTEAVQILSTSISWQLDGTNKIVASPDDANKLKVYTADADGNIVALVSDGKMTAGSSYILELPAVYALDDAKSATPTALTVKKDYKVTWQYREFGTSQWGDYPNTSAGNTVLITPDYSGYQFQAVVTPIYDNDHLTGYKTAAAYTNDVATGKTSFLVTDPTEKTELQATTTDLAITGAVEEAANQVLFGETKFGWGNHLVQYENQTVTLKATVTDNATGLGVNSVGKVYFYRYTNDSVDNNDVLLNANGQGIEVGPDGIATMNYTMPDYDSTKAASAEENCSRIYAVYVEGVTYDTSASVSFTTDTLGAKTYGKPNSGLKNMVFSKSTAIQTPVIDAKRGTTNEGSTSYTADLTDLLAGVEHKFTLRTTGAEATGLTSDWSVVALDGRTVASTDYTIKWLATTGDNEEATVANGSSYTTSDNKVGDMFRVELVPTGDMKTGATSKYAKIGTKQDVNVTVTASDEITSTEVDRANGKYPDVYQLNEIKLTATVAAAQGANATVKPSGTVEFYYELANGKTYKLGEASLAESTDGTMKASITTTELPVLSGDNTKLNVTITAVYKGDATFNKSGEFVNASSAINDTITGTVNDATVTVYSSVVYVKDTVENKTVTVIDANKNHTSGIYIYAEEDKVLANETNVNLMLSDVYTLDHDPTLALSKLAHGVDYTVQWQVLVNAAAYSDKTTAPWENITGATNTSCQIDVEDGAAYRAVITVKDTPIAKGSYTFVGQDIDGRQVYYSNILVAADAPATVTVNVNTDNTNDGFEGIVEDEKVTIHTYASGASGTTPISELTVTITELDTDGITPVAVVNEQVKTNVNGHVSFDWTAADPGYYELKVVAKFTNGYDDKIITRTLIVRDNDYSFTVSGDGVAYNGKAQGLKVAVDNMGIESALAQKSVVVYYYTDEARTQQVEPTQAGTYYATIRLQESAYWTEKTEETTLTIKQREVSVVDLVAQAKVYDGTTNANIQEIILEDAATEQTGSGLPTDNTGIINGDSVYAVGTAVTNSANVNEANSVTVTVTELLGDDAANYKLADATYTEAFNIQRSQVKGDIANSTFKYTGSNITVPADDIYLIDQAGNRMNPADYTVTYYYHNGDGVEKVDAMNKLGKYTVIARPEQVNYKGGASQTVYVVSDNAVDKDPDTTAKSALINITNTVELYGATTGIVASATNGATTTVTYWNGTAWGDRPTDAGRYLVKVTASTGDTAYGIYTIVKARPALELSATGAEYTSAQISGTPTGTFNGAAFPAGTYFTYAGGTIQGVAYEAPTEVGTYIVTAHVPETADYTAHEISAQFVIMPKALEITADSLQRRQYGAFPDMTASFDGLADSVYAPDTSLRDVQIQPELIFNETDGYDNIAMDHVGNEYPIIAIAALARNYDVSYVNGNLSVTRDEPNPYLAIHGMIDNGNGGDIAYYGDVIQLYAYGSQSETGVINNSSVLTWSVTGPAEFVTGHDGLLKINGVGTFTVTLTRGIGAQKISTTLTINALPKEVSVHVADQDKVYNASEQTYNGTVTVEGLIGTDTVTPTVVTGTDKRTNVGSQITQYKVTDTKYVSETYGGLFTINDKEVTVKPTAATTPYGTPVTGLTYTVKDKNDNTVTGVLSNDKAVSVADLYGNLDVYDGYEILVAGTENINYNVKYETKDNTNAATIGDVKVDYLDLNVSTGTLDDNIALTSGSRNPLGNYPANGAEVASTAALGAANVRMYGEPNWVMDYALATLISGDSLADLALDPLAGNLVKFNYNIGADANITYPTRNDASPTAVAGRSAYNVDTDASMIAFGNYNESYNKGTQNIYQRPVTLALSNSQISLDIYFAEILMSGGTIDTAKLLNIIINNVEAGKYNDGTNYVGGLAELLKHTVKDLNLQVAISGYTGSPDNQFTATVTVGNPNYWLGNAGQKFDITVNILPQKLTVDYTTFTATFSDVVLYQQSEATRVAANATGDVTFKIYRYVEGKENYSYYAANEATVFSGTMTRDTSRTGRYYVTYPKLSAGTYRVFAVASGYTIID